MCSVHITVNVPDKRSTTKFWGGLLDDVWNVLGSCLASVWKVWGKFVLFSVEGLLGGWGRFGEGLGEVLNMHLQSV